MSFWLFLITSQFKIHLQNSQIHEITDFARIKITDQTSFLISKFGSRISRRSKSKITIWQGSKSRDHSFYWSNIENCKWQDHVIINYDPDFLINMKRSTKTKIPRSADHRLKWSKNLKIKFSTLKNDDQFFHVPIKFEPAAHHA